MRDQTDSQLLDQFRHQECERAFECLVERYMPMVHGVCSRVLNCYTEAEDAAQAVFVTLALKADGLNADKGLAAWLHKVAHAVSVDIVRKNQRRDTRELAACAMEEVARDLPRTDARLEHLDAAVKALPKPLREAIIRHYMLGWSVVQIAEADGVSASAVTMRLTRARERLKKSLALGSTAAVAALLGLAHPSKAGASLPLLAAVMQSVRSALLGVHTATGPMAAAVAMAQELLRRWAARRMAITSATAVLMGILLGALVALIWPMRATANSGVGAKLQDDAANASAKDDNQTVQQAALEYEHPLIRAAKKRYEWKDVIEFKKILDRVPSPIDDIRDSLGRTALHWASLSCGHDTHLLLMRRGASVNARDIYGKTPLTYAVETNHDWILLQYLLAGADPNVVAADQSTPLAWAARNDNPRMCDILLWMGASPNPPGVTGEWVPLEAARAGGGQKVREIFDRYMGQAGRTWHDNPRELPVFVKESLFTAVSRGDFETIEYLLDRNMSIDTRDNSGRTALHRAINAIQGDVVFYLLLRGADPNALDLNGVSPMMATMGGVGGPHDAARRFLFWKGANPHYVRPDQHSELTYAASKDADHGLQWLIWYGANPWLPSPKFGSCYQISFREANQRQIDILERNGVKEQVPEIHDVQERFHHATKRGDIKGMEEALKNGAELDKPYGPSGNSALMQSIIRRNEPAAHFLLSRGASINFVNPKDGDTPLGSTLRWSSPDMSILRKRMLSLGADPNFKDSKGTPAIMRISAFGPGPADTLKEIIAAGADINARDANGRTVLTREIDRGHYETVEYLKSLGATL